MERVKGKITAIPIGLDNVHVAVLTADPKDGTAAYATPEYLSRALSVNLTPILKEGVLDSDDNVEIDESMIAGYTVSFGTSQLDDYARAKIFGHRIDSTGGLVVSKNDKPPIIALLGRSKLSDRVNFEYFALYKGSFKPNAAERETDKREGTTYKTETVEGTFYPRESDGNIKYTMRTDNENCDSTKIQNWFTAVQEPAAESAEDNSSEDNSSQENG